MGINTEYLRKLNAVNEMVDASLFPYCEVVTYTFTSVPVEGIDEMNRKLKKYYSRLAKRLKVHIYPIIYISMKNRFVYHCVELMSAKPRIGNKVRPVRDARYAMWKKVWKKDGEVSAAGFVRTKNFKKGYQTRKTFLRFIREQLKIHPKTFKYSFLQAIIEAPFQPKDSQRMEVFPERIKVDFAKHKLIKALR